MQAGQCATPPAGSGVTGAAVPETETTGARGTGRQSTETENILDQK